MIFQYTKLSILYIICNKKETKSDKYYQAKRKEEKQNKHPHNSKAILLPLLADIIEGGQ